jgi:hypothetical protein
MTRVNVERLRELLHYAPISGVFTWKVYRGRKAKAGDIAGDTSNSRGYRHIMIDGKSYKASCLAWLYMTGDWPSADVDHRDTDRLNDKWGNLRLATKSQNAANRSKPSHNTSGFKGVFLRKDTGKWSARISVRYRHIYLGCFETAQEAHEAYAAAAHQYFGEFARAA